VTLARQADWWRSSNHPPRRRHRACFTVAFARGKVSEPHDHRGESFFGQSQLGQSRSWRSALVADWSQSKPPGRCVAGEPNLQLGHYLSTHPAKYGNSQQMYVPDPLRVEVKHRGPPPMRYTWELCSDGKPLPVAESLDRFHSWEEASEAGRKAMGIFAAAERAQLNKTDPDSTFGTVSREIVRD
jgi:hypothetical protein